MTIIASAAPRRNPGIAPADADELFRRHLPYMTAVAARCLRLEDARDPAADADDFAQATALAAFRHLARFDPARGKFTTWLALRVRSAIFNARTAAGRQKRGRGLDAAGRTRRLRTAADPKGQLDHTADFRDAIRRMLHGDERTALTLRFVDGLELREVAAEMGVSFGKVRILLGKALEKLGAKRPDLARVLGRD